jgi:hypothetical protein
VGWTAISGSTCATIGACQGSGAQHTLTPCHKLLDLYVYVPCARVRHSKTVLQGCKANQTGMQVVADIQARGMACMD